MMQVFDMKALKLGGSAVLSLLLAQPSLADVTPEDVWQNWQGIYAEMGGKLTTTSVDRIGDTLVISGLKNTVDAGLGKNEVALDELRLRDLGDGTVEVTMSDELRFSSETPGFEGAKTIGTKGRAKMPDLLGTVSGTPEDMAYALEMPQLDLLVEPREDGKAIGKLELLLSGCIARYHLAGPADAKQLDGEFKASSAALNLDGEDANTGLRASVNAADVSAHMTGNFAGFEEADLADALAKGLAVDMGFGVGALNYDFDVSGSDTARLTGDSQGGDMRIAIDAAKILMAGSGKAVKASFSSADLPIPEVGFSYDEGAFNLTMPLAKADGPQDFTVLTKIVNLQTVEELWALFDPMGLLPHDPATLVFDASGQVRLKSDLMASAKGAAPDGELHALSINEITARFGGADLTGQGALTFDNDDLTTYSGVPAPTGKLDFKLLGGNAFLDKLVNMGLIGPDEAMGARLMLAMFSKVGPGPDELTSALEFKDKHFFANGQQLQ